MVLSVHPVAVFEHCRANRTGSQSFDQPLQGVNGDDRGKSESLRGFSGTQLPADAPGLG